MKKIIYELFIASSIGLFLWAVDKLIFPETRTMLYGVIGLIMATRIIEREV